MPPFVFVPESKQQADECEDHEEHERRADRLPEGVFGGWGGTDRQFSVRASDQGHRSGKEELDDYRYDPRCGGYSHMLQHC